MKIINSTNRPPQLSNVSLWSIGWNIWNYARPGWIRGGLQDIIRTSDVNKGPKNLQVPVSNGSNSGFGSSVPWALRYRTPLFQGNRQTGFWQCWNETSTFRTLMSLVKVPTDIPDAKKRTVGVFTPDRQSSVDFQCSGSASALAVLWQCSDFQWTSSAPRRRAGYPERWHVIIWVARHVILLDGQKIRCHLDGDRLK